MIKVKQSKKGFHMVTELDKYLASRHVDPATRTPKTITEYFCSTCLVQEDITKYGDFEKNQPIKSMWTPLFGKRLNIGIIFTINSAMFKYHFKLKKSHNWGLYQPFLKPNP